VKDDGSDNFQGVKLNRFAMQEIVGNVCYLTVRPPQQGSYLLVVYAKDLNEKVLVVIVLHFHFNLSNFLT